MVGEMVVVKVGVTVVVTVEIKMIRVGVVVVATMMAMEIVK